MLAWALIGVVTASLWSAMWVRAQGHPVALVGPGTYGPAWPLLEDEIGVDLGWRFAGHDGGMFYAVARTPLHPERAAPSLDHPSYRARRILYPLAAGLLAPGGGMALVYAMWAVSLVGVGIGTAALASLPGARRRWLPIVVPLTPGVLAAVLVGLSDALAVGLVLAAFAAAYRRRWGLLLVAAVLAVLTRETALLAVAGLTFTPAMPSRVRTATVLLPVAALAGWMGWLHHVFAQFRDPKAIEAFTWPLLGWWDAEASSLALGVLSATVLVLALSRVHPADRHVGVFMGLTLVTSSVLSPDVTGSWVDASRIAAPALPLALWICFRHQAAPGAAPEVVTAEARLGQPSSPLVAS